jgi:tetratricopeptide (TPR) repeat protein
MKLILEFAVGKAVAKLSGALLATSSVLLSLLVVDKFVVSVLSDKRFLASQERLDWAANRFPNSPRLHARLAEVELIKGQPDLELARFHAWRAVELSPRDHNNRLILASVLESSGDRQGAEDALRAAIQLAPYDADVRWRLANLLLRRGRIRQSLDQFRAAVEFDASLLGATFDLVWEISGNKSDPLRQIVGSDPAMRLALARFLAKKGRAEEATSLFGQIDVRARLASKESPAFIEDLISMGRSDLARRAWIELMGGTPELIWNGGFELDRTNGLDQFDWKIEQSRYARIKIDSGTSHGGSRSLRIDFLGRDTTRLDGQIWQRICLEPGKRYRLQCYAKAEGFSSPEGLRLVLMAGNNPIVESAPILGSNEWRRLAVDFTGPADQVLYVTIRLLPKYSYEEPTRGTIWFDDFTLTEITSQN